ncbi:MAG: histidine phosphatase family protein [bacterium]
MRIILIRQGSRKHYKTLEGTNMPLSDEGRKEARELGEMLARLNLKPQAYLTSHYKYAKEIADILATQLAN